MAYGWNHSAIECVGGKLAGSINSSVADHVLVILLLLMVVVTPAGAATFVVDRFDDPAPDTCVVDGCSLREAIIDANATPGDDDVTLAAGTYTLDRAGTDDSGSLGDLDVTEVGAKVTVTGVAGSTTISVSAVERAFHVLANATLELSTLTVSGKSSTAHGAIQVAATGTLDLDQVSLSLNTTNADRGGAIDNHGTVTMSNSIMDSNAGGLGGAVSNFGVFTATGSTFSKNDALVDSGLRGFGGAFYNVGTLDLTNSTLSGNITHGLIVIPFSSRGMGIYNAGNVTLTNVTIADHLNGTGGGEHGINQTVDGTTTMQNVLIAGDRDQPCSGPGTWISLGNNLFEANGVATCGGVPEDLNLTDPRIGALLDNSGPNRTHKPFELSPAIDGGADVSGLGITTDQRGIARPQRSAYDIGAVEVEPGAPEIDVNTTADGADAVPGDGVCEITPSGGDCGLYAAVQEAQASARVVINVPAGTYPIALAMFITTDLQVIGAGSATTIIDAQSAITQFSLLNPNSGLTLTGVSLVNGSGGKGGCLNNTFGVGVTLADVVFDNCQALGGGLAQGGAIYNQNDLEAFDCVIRNSGATGGGGGVANNSTGELRMTDCIFENNSARAGGGLYTVVFGIVDLLRVTFDTNTATNGGGAIISRSKVTLTDSLLINNSTSGSSGGGVFSSTGSASLTLVNTTVTGNQATAFSAFGGGVSASESIQLTITNSEITNNTTTMGGGGIFTSNTPTTIYGSTLSGNTADDGGGIGHFGSALNISNSTISGNMATVDAGSNGGGLWLSGGATTMRNVTISGNTAASLGGGIAAVFGATGPRTLDLNNLTITANTAGGRGGGIYNDNSVMVRPINTIISNNERGTGAIENCFSSGTLFSQGHNVADDSSCALTATGDQPSTPVALFPLANNGGAAQTHRPGPVSAAVDLGDPGAPGTGGTTCEATDQRGVVRPLDGDDTGGARCDIGAYEEDVPFTGDIADLEISKTGPASGVEVLDLITYTIEVKNNGPDGDSGVIVTDVLPTPSTFVSATPGQGGPCTEDAGVVTCDLGPLANAATATITVEMIPLLDGLISNTASVTGNAFDTNQANNSSTTETTVDPAADLAITIENGVDMLPPGQPVTYTIVAANNGPSDISGVRVVGGGPSPPYLNCNWGCVPAGGATCSTGPFNSNTIDDNLDMPAGSTGTYTFSCDLALIRVEVYSPGGQIIMPGGITELDLSNNNASDTDDPATDFGDALLKNNESFHALSSDLKLGQLVDAENLHQTFDSFATGDDNDGTDDEDGVFFKSAFIKDQTTFIDVVATGPGLLNAWADFGTQWSDPSEQIFTDEPLVAGINSLDFFVPDSGATGGFAPMRFRFSTQAGLSADGPAVDGEIEDYMLFRMASDDTDPDNDGVEAAVEDAGPNGGDGNHDGILDSLQFNVTSIPNAEDGQYLVIVSAPGTFLTNVAAIDPGSLGPPPPDAIFPVGAVRFNVEGIAPGASTMVEILLPVGVNAVSHFKFGDEPLVSGDHWYEFLDDGTTGATVLPDKVVLKLVDGDRGDDDIAANGVIVDPGAVAVTNTVFADGFED